MLVFVMKHFCCKNVLFQNKGAMDTFKAIIVKEIVEFENNSLSVCTKGKGVIALVVLESVKRTNYIKLVH